MGHWVYFLCDELSVAPARAGARGLIYFSIPVEPNSQARRHQAGQIDLLAVVEPELNLIALLCITEGNWVDRDRPPD